MVTKLKVLSVALVPALMGLAASAHAEIPAAATAAITEMKETATSYLDAAWPIVLLVMGGMIGIKMFKKVIGRAFS